MHDLVPPWRPEPETVRKFIPQRGHATGLHGDPTVPDVDLEGLIDTVVSDVQTEVGDIPERFWDEARAVTALGAASYLEQGLFPEAGQVEYGASQTLERRYLARLRRLAERVSRDRDGALGSVKIIGGSREAAERIRSRSGFW